MRLFLRRLTLIALAAPLLAAPALAAGQGIGARVDPTLVAGKRPRDAAVREEASSRLEVNSAPATSAAGPMQAVQVGAIRVDGAEGLDQAELMAKVAPYIGRMLDGDALREVLGAVSGVARAHGYVFARSDIPEQAMVGGVLHVRLDMGRIDRISQLGLQSRAVAAVLAPLLGKPARKDELERRLMLATDLPGIWIGAVNYARDGESGLLTLEVKHRKASGHLEIDNRGQSELGPVRVAIGYDFAGLLGDDRLGLSLQGLATPADPKELVVTSARLAYVFTDMGTELAVTGVYSHTHSGGAMAPFNITGVGRIAEVSLSQPLYRRRNASLWLSGALDYFSVDQWLAGTRFRRDRVAVANLSLNGNAALAGGRLRGGLGVARALPGGTLPGDALASRAGNGSTGTIFTVWSTWQGTIAGPLSAKLGFNAQFATAPVLSVSQIALGGPQYGRAYDFAERTGDSGVLGSAELDYRLVERQSGTLRSVQLYGFADGGHVWNLQNSLGSGNLSSAGVGTRVSLLDRYRIGLEAAMPLASPRLQSANHAPRLSFSVGADF